MEPADFSSSSSDYDNGTENENEPKKRDFFEMAFDPWTGAGGSSSLFKGNLDEGQTKKSRFFDKEPFFGIGLGLERPLESDVKERGKSTMDEDEQRNLDDNKEIPIDGQPSSLNKLDTETEMDTSEVLPSGAAPVASVEGKTVDDRDDDPEQEVSSPTTTPPQSSSEPEQTPRSSNEGDGDKSDKGESESSKSMQVTGGTTNGCMINYISPSITKRSVTLEMLLAAGVLKPGEGTMSLEYHGQKFVGDLLENGQIRSQETSQIFSSPSAWATTCKQIINPDKSLKKSGCGWASIKYKSLKLDYYKAVWLLYIDIRNISNGAVSSSSDTDEEDRPHCILKFGEHFENNPRNQSAQQIGAKILISCTEFKEMERLQPFHVKVSAEALALADFHCNVTSTEAVGYISGRWNGDQNTLRMEMVHPCRVLMPASTAIECDNERNRIAIEIQRLGHEVVGWYHSHPKAPPIPSKDDIGRQLDYQIMMKGASEASYIPCVGIIISPLCYSEQSDTHKSNVQFFWAMPPPENRPLEMGRPMHIDYETYPSTNFDPRKLLVNMNGLIDFYKGYKELVDLNELGLGKLERLKETVSTWLPALKMNDDLWSVIQQNMKSEISDPPKTRSPSIPSKVNSSSTSTSSSPATHMMEERDFEGEPPETNNHHQKEDRVEEESEQGPCNV